MKETELKFHNPNPEDFPIINIFGEKQKEILRFERNGDIYVHGKLVENDKEVVEGFRDFLIGRNLLSR